MTNNDGLEKGQTVDFETLMRIKRQQQERKKDEAATNRRRKRKAATESTKNGKSDEQKLPDSFGT